MLKVYERGEGIASCAKCGGQSWYKFFVNGKPVGGDYKSRRDLLLFEPDL